MTHLPAWDIRVALEQFPNQKQSFIPEILWEVVQAAVVHQCDALDGVVDGLVSDPSRYVESSGTTSCTSMETFYYEVLIR